MEHLDICADVRFLIIKQENCTDMLFQICAVVRFLCLNKVAEKLCFVMLNKTVHSSVFHVQDQICCFECG